MKKGNFDDIPKNERKSYKDKRATERMIKSHHKGICSVQGISQVES